MKLEDKVVVVTGGGGGIGRELVLHLLSKEARVVALDINEAGLKETIAVASAAKGRLSTMVADITNRETVEMLPERIQAEVGPVDALINNAGIMHPFIKLNDLGFETIERVMKVNLF